MRNTRLGPFADVSRLTLGEGGLGQIWGESSEAEAVATVHAALAAGINMIDTAPSYGACEAVIASALRGVVPAGVRITTKCQLGTASVGSVATKLEESLDASLEAMRLDRVDLYFLHSNICEDDTVYAHGNEYRAAFATPWSQYVEEVVPAFEDLERRGRIGAWGITGVGARSRSFRRRRVPARLGSESAHPVRRGCPSARKSSCLGSSAYDGRLSDRASTPTRRATLSDAPS